MRKMKLLGGLLAVALLVTACGGGDDSTASSATTQLLDDAGLRPAKEVVEEEERSKTLDAKVGDEIALGLGLNVTVSAVRVAGDDLGVWLEVDIRAENRGESVTNPGMAIVCTGGNDKGGWQVDSTFDLFDELPSDSFNEGTIHLLLPEDGRFGEPVPECLAPAFVRVTPNGVVVMTGEEPQQRTVDYEIPADVLAELNASRFTG